jgi:hypothetical protein
MIRKAAVEVFNLVNESMTFIALREVNRDHLLQGLHYCSSWMHCLRNMHEAMDNSLSGSSIPAFGILTEPLSSKWLNSVTVFFFAHCY